MKAEHRHIWGDEAIIAAKPPYMGALSGAEFMSKRNDLLMVLRLERNDVLRYDNLPTPNNEANGLVGK